tara:strand:- start:481 stop:1413 length:933 start_codon:yes stop_codon:yes gene_type:complete
MKIKATGIANKSSNDEMLDIFFPCIESIDKKVVNQISDIEDTSKELIKIEWGEEDLSRPIKDIKDAYLKLHLLSYRFVLPNSVNLDGLFSALPNVVWTNFGPVSMDEIDERLMESKLLNRSTSTNGVNDMFIRSIDKFPCLTDYIIPKNVRIADASRVRLGAYLSEGTTVMHEGFVNFNAGTLGAAMIEGRISAGVIIGKNSDIGGGASTMGTLSGGNKTTISIGENCLLGANSGIGISLGNNCIVEAGLYLTSGTKVSMEIDSKIEVVKAYELSGASNMLFYRDSTNGKVIASANKKVSNLNKDLHKND